jgi:hypothetical protein
MTFTKDPWTRTAQIQISTCLDSFEQPILCLRQLKKERKIGQGFLVLIGVCTVPAFPNEFWYIFCMYWVSHFYGNNKFLEFGFQMVGSIW